MDERRDQLMSQGRLGPNEGLALRINNSGGQLAGYITLDPTSEHCLIFVPADRATNSPYREMVERTQRLAPDLAAGSGLSPQEQELIARMFGVDRTADAAPDQPEFRNARGQTADQDPLGAVAAGGLLGMLRR